MKLSSIGTLLAFLLILSGCAGLPFGQGALSTTTPNTTTDTPLQREQKQQQLLAAADQIADRLREGELTRLQAAEALNQQRLKIVGANPIDDEVFARYRELIAKVQAGRLSQTDLRQRLKQKLNSVNAQPWQTRQSTPPLFTHFLLKTIYGQTAR